MANLNMEVLGKKSLEPVLNLVHRYKDDLNPYLNSLSRGLKAAMDSYQTEGSEADKVVSGWINQFNNWFDGLKNTLETKNPQDFLNYIEQQAKAHPGIMFSASYVMGIVMGKLGRDVVKMGKETLSTSDPIDQDLHTENNPIQ